MDVKIFCVLSEYPVRLIILLDGFTSSDLFRWWNQYSLLPWPDTLAIYVSGFLIGKVLVVLISVLVPILILSWCRRSGRGWWGGTLWGTACSPTACAWGRSASGWKRGFPTSRYFRIQQQRNIHLNLHLAAPRWRRTDEGWWTESASGPWHQGFSCQDIIFGSMIKWKLQSRWAPTSGSYLWSGRLIYVLERWLRVT